MSYPSILVATYLVLAVSASASDSPIPGVHMGESSLADVLLALGSAEGAFLAGEDTEGGPKEGDPVVLRFVRDYQLIDVHHAEVWAYFDPATFKLTGVVVRFDQSVSSEEVRNRFGSDFEDLRQRMVLLPDGLEGVVEDCRDPSGPHRSWVFKAHSLQVEIEEEGSVSALRFTQDIASILGLPLCVR